MAGAGLLKLVAHRAGYDLLFSVSELLEVVDAGDLSRVPGDSSGEGGFLLRGQPLAIPDLSTWLGPPPGGNDQGGQLLVISGPDAPFGVLIDEVCGIFAADQFRYRDLPLMLRSPNRQCYEKIALWRDRVLLCCDASRLEACGR